VPQNATGFERLAKTLISRRGFVGNSVAFGAAAFILSGVRAGNGHAANRLNFEPIAASKQDMVRVPKGYSWHVVAKWGEPLWSSGTAFDQKTRGTGDSQARAFGDNNDGMALFSQDGRNILAVNNEYPNRRIIFGNRRSARPENTDDVRKGMSAVGVSVCEIAKEGGRWSIVKNSPFNRRITADTPMEITGPARGHALLQTADDPNGMRSKGTWANCGNGRTPWGTYLTCEENFDGFFSKGGGAYAPGLAQARYGVGQKDWGYGWATTDDRFDLSKHPNEPNRTGYVVEIDPTKSSSVPRKRTALGRFKHENAEVVVTDRGRVVIYMGDDERGEFLYKFVSDGTYVDGGDNSDLLDSGGLFAARFDDDFRGEWLALTPATTGMKSQAEICIHTRMAASAIGATTMDRPEWVAANPNTADVYCALTNNKNRGRKPNSGGDAMPVGGPNSRAKNQYGQIVRWTPNDADHESRHFTWDLFVLAGNPTVHSGAYAGSKNINAGNMFNSPDGLSFDSTGLLWIRTDGNYKDKGDFAGMGNNQMLVGNPETGEIRRFLVGPNGCEVTGLTWSADRRTLFVGIQHPGERGSASHFPDGGDTVPRSCVIAVTKHDGGLIG
jgi:secreted PhoX family phosphatase